MKNLKHEKETLSYMQLCLYQEGKGNLYLMVPTFWDALHKNWFGFIKTQKTERLVTARGKNDFELQNEFNIEISKVMNECPKMGQEVFEMFKPLEYWESRL